MRNVSLRYINLFVLYIFENKQFYSKDIPYLSQDVHSHCINYTFRNFHLLVNEYEAEVFSTW
jgi:hypothetical protein